MYVGLGADEILCGGAGKPPCKYTTPQQVLDLLPSCYSEKFDDCLDVFRAGTAQSSFCAKYYEAFRSSTDAAWEKAMDEMPACSRSQIMSPIGYGVIGAAVVAGIMIGFAIPTRAKG